MKRFMNRFMKCLFVITVSILLFGCASAPADRNTEVIPQQTVEAITLTFPSTMSAEAVQDLVKSGRLIYIHQEMRIEDAAFKGGSQEGGTATPKTDTAIDANIPVYSNPDIPSTLPPSTKPPEGKPPIVKPLPDEKPPIIKPPVEPGTLIYSHYNPNGNVCGGDDTSSFVICKDQEWYDSCEISGVELDKHSGLNEGKKVYKKCHVPNLAGTVTCKKDGKVYTTQVNANGLQKDGCY